MTEDTVPSTRRKKRSHTASSPDEPPRKLKQGSTEPTRDKISSGKKNKQSTQEGKGNNSMATSGAARKKLVKSTGTKKISGNKNWNDLKQKKKDLRLLRRKTSKATTYDDMVKAKKLWEKVRMARCPPEQREQLITDIYTMLKDNLQKLVFTHDGARVIQWLLKMGAPPLRIIISNQLEPVLPLMAQSKYASFCVRRIFKYGSSESHAKVINAFAGYVVKFMCHSVAAPVLEFAYSQWATSRQKAALRQECYGRMAQVATPGEIHRLADVYKDTPELKEAILTVTRNNITKVLNKMLVRSSLLHAVTLDYLKECPDRQSEMLAQLRPFLLDLLISQEGSRVAMMCIWQGSVKDRKAAIKLLKGRVKEVAMSEYGHWLLLAMFDCIDDTVLLKKVVIPEIVDNLLEIASNENGRQVILYLVGYRDPLCFHPAFIKALQEGLNNDVSKKDPALRRAELLEAISDSLLGAIAEEPQVWLASSSIVIVTLAALKYGVGKSLNLAFEAVSKFVSHPSNMMSFGDKECHAIEHSGVHFLLKKLIENDRKKDSSESFSSIFVSIIEPATVEWWIDYNRGCFILLMLLEKGSAERKKKIKEKFSNKILKKLSTKDSVGAKLLLGKLA